MPSVEVYKYTDIHSIDSNVFEAIAKQQNVLQKSKRIAIFLEF